MRVLNIGHRGAAADAPENTMAAFELARRQGADGIEFDVHLSADGVPVVIHDARLRRTTSGAGRVSQFSLAALKRLDVGSRFNRRFPARARARYAGLKIPTLAEVLGWVGKQKCLAFLEIKHPRKRYVGIEARILKEIYYAGVHSQTTIISFNFPTLMRVREIDSRISLGMDFTRPVVAMRRAKRIAAKTLLPYWAFAPRRFLRRAHRAGISVLVWGLDEPLWMERRIADGVDGIITRYPAKLREIIRRLEIEAAWPEGRRRRAGR